MGGRPQLSVLSGSAGEEINHVARVRGRRIGQPSRPMEIIAFKRQNLSYTERYFAETFEEHGLNDNVAYTCDDTFSLISLVSSGLGVGFAPEWTGELPGRDVVLKKVTGIDLKIGLGVAWSKDDPTAARDDIIDIARTLGRSGR